MTRTLLRNCVDCGRSVRGKPRCRDCEANRDRAKHARRPDARSYAEQERRRRLVADHRARVGDWCPGLDQHPAHPCADLVADHVIEVAAGGPEAGPLRVLCRSENSRRSANLLSPMEPTPLSPRPPNLATHTALSTGVDNGPVVA
jgi:hypothetical protein